MTAGKNIAFMAASTAVRLLFGILTFTLLARLLGPNLFGILMFWLSVATLVSMVSNYGFSNYLLKQISAEPGSIELIFNQVFASKILVSGTIIILALCILPFIGTDVRWVFFLLLIAMLTDSMTEFFNVGYRTTNRFSSEARIATKASVAQFLIVVGGVWYSSNEMAAACSFLFSRICVLGMTWSSQRVYFSGIKPGTFRSAFFRLRHGSTYAIDFGLQSLIGQVDSIILNHFMGPLAVGLHHAGMRLFLGGGQVANVLGNVFIPRIATILNEPEALMHEAKRMRHSFFCAGAVFGLTLAVAAVPIVRILFGPAFSQLALLLPWFGLLFFVRFIAGAYGVLLTGAGKQSFRAKANLVHWIIILCFSWLLVPRLGNVGWLLALIVGNLYLGYVYYKAAYKITLVPRAEFFFLAVVTTSFFPFLFEH